MKDHLEKAKELFFAENFPKAFEEQKEGLLKFFSEQAAKEKLLRELELQWNVVKETFHKEVELFFRECERRLSSSDLEKLHQEILTNQEQYDRASQQEIAGNPESITKWSDNFLETALKIAKDLSQETRYQEASYLFHMLTVLRPDICDFWVGLGISLYDNSQVQESIDVYKIAAELTNYEHPLPLLYLSESLNQMESKSQAKETLKSALALLSKKEEFLIYSSEAQRISNLL